MVKLVSLSDIAQETQLNKSRLSYYAKLGLLKKAYQGTVSKTQVYDEKKLIKRLEEIEDLQEHGLSLQEIIKKLK